MKQEIHFTLVHQSASIKWSLSLEIHPFVYPTLLDGKLAPPSYRLSDLTTSRIYVTFFVTMFFLSGGVLCLPQTQSFAGDFT